MQEKSLKNPTKNLTNDILPVKKAAICTNLYNDPSFEYAKKAAELLQEMGIKYSVFTVDPLPKNMPKCPDIPILTPAAALRGADVLVCIGGDGTILHSAGQAAVRGIPVLGINLGHRGFMTELAKNELERLKTILSGDFECYHRMMADVSILRDGRCVYSALALNDAVITKGVEARIIDMSVLADDALVSRFSGDGMVVCTPTGSTAYSMSAGGPIVEPEAENMIVTPICAHSLQAKSFVLAPGRRVSIEIGELKDRSAYLSVDGGKAKRLQDGDIVVVSRSQHKLLLIKADKKSFYNKVYFKLNTPRGG